MKKLFLMICCVALLAACGSPVDKMEKFVEKTEKNYENFDADDWEENAKEMEELSEEIAKEENLSKEDKERCAELAGRYSKVLMKKGGSMLKGLFK